jgi:hypothetical protein
MKKTVFLFIMLNLAITALPQNPFVRLEIEASSTHIFLGDHLTITVRIYDPSIPLLIKSEKLMDPLPGFQTMMNPFAFEYSFMVKPIDTGLVKIGPIELEYQNQQLKSNELSVFVSKKDSNKYFIFDAPQKVSCYDIRYIELRSNYTNLKDIDLPASTYYKIMGSSASSETSTKDGKSEIEYRKSFRVEFQKKGTLIFTKDNLVNFPKSLNLEPVKIIIE